MKLLPFLFLCLVVSCQSERFPEIVRYRTPNSGSAILYTKNPSSSWESYIWEEEERHKIGEFLRESGYKVFVLRRLPKDNSESSLQSIFTEQTFLQKDTEILEQFAIQQKFDLVFQFRSKQAQGRQIEVLRSQITKGETMRIRWENLPESGLTKKNLTTLLEGL